MTHARRGHRTPEPTIERKSSRWTLVADADPAALARFVSALADAGRTQRRRVLTKRSLDA